MLGSWCSLLLSDTRTHMHRKLWLECPMIWTAHHIFYQWLTAGEFGTSFWLSEIWEWGYRKPAKHQAILDLHRSNMFQKDTIFQKYITSCGEGRRENKGKGKVMWNSVWNHVRREPRKRSILAAVLRKEKLDLHGSTEVDRPERCECSHRMDKDQKPRMILV